MIQPIVFCKAPVPGRVKTRLMSQLDAEQAAELHARMARHVIAKLAGLWPELWVAADVPAHPFFAGLGARIVPQGGGDLGARMLRCARRAFAGGAGGVLLLGTDSPHMPEERLRRAVEGLARADVVLGPVEDGGYDLLALGRLEPRLFEDIAWGSPRVREQTLERARISQLSVLELDCAFDIDTPADLERARALGLDWLEPF